MIKKVCVFSFLYRVRGVENENGEGWGKKRKKGRKRQRPRQRDRDTQRERGREREREEKEIETVTERQRCTEKQGWQGEKERGRIERIRESNLSIHQQELC